MSPERRVLRRTSHRAEARSASMRVSIPIPSSREFAPGFDRMRCDDSRPAVASAREVVGAMKPHETTSARCMLSWSPMLRPSSRAPVIADRFVSSVLTTASFVEKIALALEPAGGGINHGTVRDVLDSSRANGKQPTHHAIDTLSGIVVAGHTEPALRSVSDVPRAKPSRSDRTSVGCTFREDQGGPQ